MVRKLVLAAATAALLVICISCDFGLCEVSVIVKEGDWIEYNVNTTGDPPEEHNVTWARLEILGVEGNNIRINSTSLARNGSISSLFMTLNPEKGQIGAWWIISANLNPGETFYDAFLNVTLAVKGEEQLEYAGAVRTITNITVPGRVKQWDKATGVFVLSDDELPDYSIRVSAYRTNIWGSQLPSPNLTVFYIIAVVAIAIAIAFVVIKVVMRRNKGEL